MEPSLDVAFPGSLIFLLQEISMIIKVLYLLRFLLLYKLRSEQRLLDPFLMLDEFSGMFLEAAILFIYLVYTLNNVSHLLITLWLLLGQFHLQLDSQIILTEVRITYTYVHIYINILENGFMLIYI